MSSDSPSSEAGPQWVFAPKPKRRTGRVVLIVALIAVVVAHAGAALYHHLFQRDATLARMLPQGWLASPQKD